MKRSAWSWFVAGATLLATPTAAQKLTKQAQQLMALTPADFQRTATLKDDPLDTTAQISTEPGFQEKRGLLKFVSYDNFLRAFIDKKTGRTDFQVYQYINYGGSWRFYQTANFETPAGPESKQVTVISRDVGSCSTYGCSFTEHIGFDVAEDLLRSIAAGYAAAPGSVWRFKFGSKAGGDWQDGMATAEVAGLLAAVDIYRASRGLPARPIAPPAAQPTAPAIAQAAPLEPPPEPAAPPPPKKKRPAITCMTCN